MAAALLANAFELLIRVRVIKPFFLFTQTLMLLVFTALLFVDSVPRWSEMLSRQGISAAVLGEKPSSLRYTKILYNIHNVRDRNHIRGQISSCDSKTAAFSQVFLTPQLNTSKKPQNQQRLTTFCW